MQTRNEFPNPYYGILISLLVGLLLGFLTVLLVTALNHVELLQEDWNRQLPWHLLLLPAVLLLIFLVRRNTLFFPYKVAQLTETPTAAHWSHAMLPANFFGTILSHLTGASVGREGALVMAGGGLVRSMGLPWAYWGPVCASIGFASITGQYWVAPFFMYEMFGRSSLTQKIYALMGGLTAVLVCNWLQMPHLFQVPDFSDESGFFSKLIFLFLFGLAAGVTMRVYKRLYAGLSEFLQKSLVLRLLGAAGLAAFLFQPEFRKFQSLGLAQLQEIGFFQGSHVAALTKLFVTLLSTSLGFLGGEFIPLVFAGVHFGSAAFASHGFDPQLGALFGAFVLFAGGTKFKWTSVVLLLGLVGFHYWFWAYFVMGTAVLFSGDRSLYKNYSRLE